MSTAHLCSWAGDPVLGVGVPHRGHREGASGHPHTRGTAPGGPGPAPQCVQQWRSLAGHTNSPGGPGRGLALECWHGQCRRNGRRQEQRRQYQSRRAAQGAQYPQRPPSTPSGGQWYTGQVPAHTSPRTPKPGARSCCKLHTDPKPTPCPCHAVKHVPRQTFGRVQAALFPQ